MKLSSTMAHDRTVKDVRMIYSVPYIAFLNEINSSRGMKVIKYLIKNDYGLLVREKIYSRSELEELKQQVNAILDMMRRRKNEILRQRYRMEARADLGGAFYNEYELGETQGLTPSDQEELEYLEKRVPD